MYTIYIVTSHIDQWENFIKPISDKTKFIFFSDTPSCLEEMKKSPASALILDTNSNAEQLRDEAIAFLQVNAFTHLTAVSTMSAEEWHDKMEGLGMLKPISSDKTAHDALQLLNQLEKLTAITDQINV